MAISPDDTSSENRLAEPVVWIVVLHYQGAENTRACLQSLCSLNEPGARVLLLDNGSPDRSGDQIAADFPQFEYRRNPTNLGFAGGCNSGVQYCIDQGADWIWVLNNDTKVAPGSLRELLASARRHPKAALLGAQVFMLDKGALVPTGGGQIDFRKGKTYERQQPPADGSELACEWISGCNLLIRASAFKAVGGFEEKYFLYFEDTDLCCRLREAGWQCLLVPAARVEHIGLQSTRGKTATWRHYYYIRNRLLFFKRHAGGSQQRVILAGVVAHLLRHTMVLPFRGEDGRRRLKAEWLGLRDYLQNKFGQADCLDW